MLCSRVWPHKYNTGMSRQWSPPRVFGTSPAAAVRFVRDDGAEYTPPLVYSPSFVQVCALCGAAWACGAVQQGTFPSRADLTLLACLRQAPSSPEREHSPWMRGGAGARASTSPGIKRARSPGLQRDSLKQRYSPGRPGSRRHQRWSNDQALREDMTDEELRELYAMDWRSALSGCVTRPACACSRRSLAVAVRLPFLATDGC